MSITIQPIMTQTAVNSEPLDAHAEAAKRAALDLLRYCSQRNWAGYDPYDGLTSPLFGLPFLQNRPARLVFIQFMKRSMINFRPLVGIAPAQNPKGLAVFSSALIKLYGLGLAENRDLVLATLGQLLQAKAPGQPRAGWGYNFDWQTRTMLVPRHTPNIICTSFAGNALLDAYEKFGDASYLAAAESAGRFIMKGLNISAMDEGICFSYTPLDQGKVHNANLLGASFLARLYAILGETELRDYAYRAARYSAGAQAEDGSWPYGENQTQKWIDNFHTGYNLTALRDFARFTGITEFEERVRKGFAFYRRHFFEDGCVPKYFHDRLYPIDVHSVAQSMLTLLKLKDLDAGNIPLATAVCAWALRNMRDGQGFFYYQKQRHYTNRISYMRWSQAWMLLALAGLLENICPERGVPQGRGLDRSEAQA